MPVDIPCRRSCIVRKYPKAITSGWRATFYYPGGGTYAGCWLNNERERYGVLETKEHIIYDGQWKNGKRHGGGTVRRRLPDGTAERIFVGEWRDDMKCGEGKQFGEDGTYYGWWLRNRRHGFGIKWYKDGSMYLGQWQADCPHGLGVFFYVNGNRYEGSYARGFKNGEGTFYHMHTGQIQKGMWESDVCKTSLIVDEFRNQADRPTEYPIPKCTLAEPDAFVRSIFQQYMNNAHKPTKSFEELACLHFVQKKRAHAHLDPTAMLISKLPRNDIPLPCTCKYPEKPIVLREL